MIPTALRLDVNASNSTVLIFSWVAPANTLAGVAITYTPSVTGLHLDPTMDTLVSFDDSALMDCRLREFSVFASNDAGRGPMASINETIPICWYLT